MASLGSLPMEDLTCPICMEGLKDPFVTPCGHSFCYSCIIFHLQNKKVCPCCSEYLTPDKVFPNYLLSKVVARAAREVHRQDGSLVEQLQAAILSDQQALQITDLNVLLATLEEKKQSMQQREKENNLELLLHFLNHSKLSKTRKLMELQEELHILNRDIHHVETRQYALPSATPALFALPDLQGQAVQQHLASSRPEATADQQQLASAAVAGRLLPGPSAADRDFNRQPPNGMTQVGGAHLVNGSFHSQLPKPGVQQEAKNFQHHGHIQQERELQAASAPQSPLPKASSLKSRQSEARALAKKDSLDAAGSNSRPANKSCPPPSLQQSISSPNTVSAHHTSDLGPQTRETGGQPPSPFKAVQSQAAATRRVEAPEAAQPAANSEVSSAPPSAATKTSKTTATSSDTGHGSQTGQRRPFDSQFEDLQQHYLQMRQQQIGGNKRRRLDSIPTGRSDDRVPSGPMEIDGPQAEAGGTSDARGLLSVWASRVLAPAADSGHTVVGPAEPGGLREFSRMLSMSRRSNFEIVASMPGASQHTSAAILSSVIFDKSTEMFASAGVSKRIFVYNYNDVVEAFGPNSNSQASGAPVAQLMSRSKLSCLSYNSFHSNQLMSSDYEGVITLWDTSTANPVTEYEAHDKRVWSVDFCPSDAQLLASGSDDGKVKVWSMNQANSVIDINVRANVCSVRYNPGSANELAVGSADHRVMLFDTRNPAKPMRVLSGHRKAVSYVLYMNERELVSASTDSTLRMWNAAECTALRRFSGHLNEKNFVGLSCEQDFIACGSETSEVFVYYRAMSRPIARTLIAPVPHNAEGAARPNCHFISALCWRPRCEKKTLLAANSQGAIKILQLNC